MITWRPLAGPAALLTLLCGLLLIAVPVTSMAEALQDSSQSLPPLPSREEQAILVKRLQIARKDVEAFAVFAENFRRNGDQRSLDQLQKPVDDYLRMHLNSLLLTGAEQGTLETTRLAAEIMLARTMLFAGLGRKEMARDSIAEIRKRFGAFQKISVEIAGKASTLDEMLRQLEKEISNLPGK